jgi:hypothetical protein
MNYFLDVPKLTKKMQTVLIDCYIKQCKEPDAPCTKRVCSTMGYLFKRKLVGLKPFCINGRSEIFFYVTEKGKIYITEVLSKNMNPGVDCESSAMHV